jgi:DNA primase
MIHPLNRRELASRYHEKLPATVRRYLNGRGIPDSLVDEKLLGWSGRRITIPVFDRSGDVIQFRYAKAPADPPDTPKVLTEVGGGAELYGWETLAKNPYRVVICEGEFDRLVLESRGFPAVTSTAGASTFPEEWLPYLAAVKHVYICFDRDAAGEAAARKLKSRLPRAKIVRLPDAVGPKGDITDYFVRLGNGLADFEVLLAIATTEGETDDESGAPLPKASPRRPSSGAPAADWLKRSIRLVEIAGKYTDLHSAGTRILGRCPFHEEKNASFTIYPATDTYYCFGCAAHGDLIQFVMQKESKTFNEAIEALERYLLTHEL